MSYEILKRHREIWQKKKILRDIYNDWYRLIVENIAEKKPVLEIGGGGGNFKQFYPNVISSDFIFCEWVDVNLDAHHLPFKKNSLGNIVMVDVLHHLEKPFLFFQEAQRVLQNSGRLIMLEPYISPFSYLIYNYFHQEDVNFSVDILRRDGVLTNKKRAFDGNSAIPTMIFFKNAELYQRNFACLRIIKKELLTFVVYPLSGGFDRKSLVPAWCLNCLTLIENILKPLKKILALRTLIVIEKHE